MSLFFSKSPNYYIRLTQSRAGNPNYNIEPEQGKSAKFVGGLFSTDDEDLIKLLRKSLSSGNREFVEAENDPFGRQHAPSQAIVEMENGRMGKVHSDRPLDPGAANIQAAIQAGVKAALPALLNSPEVEALFRKKFAAESVAPGPTGEAVGTSEAIGSVGGATETVPAKAPKSKGKSTSK